VNRAEIRFADLRCPGDRLVHHRGGAGRGGSSPESAANGIRRRHGATSAWRHCSWRFSSCCVVWRQAAGSGR
jgi:hypothetical protein